MMGSSIADYDELDAGTLELIAKFSFDKPVRLDIIHEKMIVYLFDNELAFRSFIEGFYTANDLNKAFGFLNIDIDKLEGHFPKIEMSNLKETLATLGE